MMKSALLFLSERQTPRRMLTTIPAFNKVTRRFVAGETLEEAVAAIKTLNAKGITASIDRLGEAISSAEEARGDVAAYKTIVDAIRRERLDANVSVKPTQIGLDISKDFCVEMLTEIVKYAAEDGTFVRIDMEDSGHTDATLDVYRIVRSEYANVGVVIQSYLHRSEQDVRDLLEIGTRIRLCKGAYKEPPEVAFQKKSEVDDNFVRIMKLLLPSGIYHGIATHDPRMIDETIRFARETGIGQDAFEFQMLYGVARDRQTQLVQEGFKMRVYVPYGTAWYPYFMRRLAERPANVMFVLRAMMKG
jgi:proline dehydrogenase